MTDSMRLRICYDRTRKGVEVSKSATLAFTRAEHDREEWDMFQSITDEIRQEFLAE
jgi:hypothetical protein